MLDDKELEKVVGGVRPEDIGDPILRADGLVSYRVCHKCGACMFPETIRVVAGKKKGALYPDYVCSECGEILKTIIIHDC